jgi:hypothetical protein
MEFYRLADAEYLLEYYSDKLLGKKLSLKSDATITSLEITDWGNDNYRLMAKGPAGNASTHTVERDVCDVTKFHAIIYPTDVLKARKQK